MPVNPKSSALKERFLGELGKNDIFPTPQRHSVYFINNLKVSIRTTTKSDRKIWYDVSEGVINEVDYFIYQLSSHNHFALLPSRFFVDNYDKLQDSNRRGAKIFYIDYRGKQIVSGDYSSNISEYLCSTLHDEPSKNWKQFFLKKPA
jgi:hypothetical protein